MNKSISTILSSSSADAAATHSVAPFPVPATRSLSCNGNDTEGPVGFSPDLHREGWKKRRE